MCSTYLKWKLFDNNVYMNKYTLTNHIHTCATRYYQTIETYWNIKWRPIKTIKFKLCNALTWMTSSSTIPLQSIGRCWNPYRSDSLQIVFSYSLSSYILRHSSLAVSFLSLLFFINNLFSGIRCFPSCFLAMCLNQFLDGNHSYKSEFFFMQI